LAAARVPGEGTNQVRTSVGRSEARERRTFERWDRNGGPGVVERWLLGAPWRSALVLAAIAGATAGQRYLAWADGARGWTGERTVASLVVTALLLALGWTQGRRRAAAYVAWAADRGRTPVPEPGPPTPAAWGFALTTAVAVAVGVVALGSRPTPVPPPDADGIARAVAGSSSGYALLDAASSSTGPGELSLDETELTTWYVATRDEEGACHALRFVDGELDEVAALPAPCTGAHAAELPW
jgi:hypothetical protein